MNRTLLEACVAAFVMVTAFVAQVVHNLSVGLW